MATFGNSASDKEKVLNVMKNCRQNPHVILKSFLGWKEYIFSNTFLCNQIEIIIKFFIPVRKDQKSCFE
jgi:hypothetical protein